MESTSFLNGGEFIAHNPNPGRKGLRITAESIDAYVENTGYRQMSSIHEEVCGVINCTLE